MNNGNKQVVNLTGYDVIMYAPDGSRIVKTYNASGNKVKWDYAPLQVGVVDGFPVYENRLVIKSMPPFHPDVIYIVTKQIQDAMPDRTDLITPDTRVGAVRDSYHNLMGSTCFFKASAPMMSGEQFNALRSEHAAVEVHPADRRARPAPRPLSPTEQMLKALGDLVNCANKDDLIDLLDDTQRLLVLRDVDDGIKSETFAWWDGESLNLQRIERDVISTRRGNREVIEYGEPSETHDKYGPASVADMCREMEHYAHDPRRWRLFMPGETIE